MAKEPIIIKGHLLIFSFSLNKIPIINSINVLKFIQNSKGFFSKIKGTNQTNINTKSNNCPLIPKSVNA